MEYALAIYGVYSIFVGSIMKAENTQSAIVLKVPFFIGGVLCLAPLALTLSGG